VFGGLTSDGGALVIALPPPILMASDAGYLGTQFAPLRPSGQLMVDELGVFPHSVRRDMVVTTIRGVVQGALDAIALIIIIIGVPGAFLWGLLAFVGSFIPNIGYFIAIIPPLVFAFLTGGWAMVVPVLILYALINGVVQSVVQPRVVGSAVRLTQTITFVSVLVWVAILGPIGAILAIPLTLLVRMVLVDMDPTARWWRSILGDLDETKSQMKSEDEVRKASRSERKGARRSPKLDRVEPVK